MKALLTLLLLSLTTFAAVADTQDPNVNKVFDSQKGGIYALYVRALKERPRLEGKAVFEFDIARTGAVSDCRVQSSTLDAPDLESRICARIRQMKFAPRQASLKATKTVEFFQAR